MGEFNARADAFFEKIDAGFEVAADRVAFALQELPDSRGLQQSLQKKVAINEQQIALYAVAQSFYKDSVPIEQVVELSDFAVQVDTPRVFTGNQACRFDSCKGWCAMEGDCVSQVLRDVHAAFSCFASLSLVSCR